MLYLSMLAEVLAVCLAIRIAKSRNAYAYWHRSNRFIVTNDYTKWGDASAFLNAQVLEAGTDVTSQYTIKINGKQVRVIRKGISEFSPRDHVTVRIVTKDGPLCFTKP